MKVKEIEEKISDVFVQKWDSHHDMMETLFWLC